MWLVFGAFAATGLALPPGEDAARWQSAARLAGITVGCAEADPCVTARAVDGAWELSVSGRRGRVPVPIDEPGRAAVAWLAASLARPMPTIELEDSEPTTIFLDLVAGGGGLIQGRVGLAVTGAVGVRIGRGLLAAELEGSASTAAPLPFDPDWTQARADARVGILATPARWLALGAGFAASRRSWADAGSPVAATWVPVVDGLVEARAPGRTLDVVIRLRAGADLRGVRIVEDNVQFGTLGRASASLTTGVAFHTRSW